MPVREIRLKVRGKVNLGLRILGRRQDGYHDIESVAVPVGLTDDVVVRVSRGGIELRCPGVPAPSEQNLAWKAAHAILSPFPGLGGVAIKIVKRIPVGGGMGGASADAAGVLKALSRLFGETVWPRALERVARSLGCDVPMFLQDEVTPEGAVFAFILRGRGDHVTPVRSRHTPPLYLVLALMNFSVQTSWAYARWDEMRSCGLPAGTLPDVSGPPGRSEERVAWKEGGDVDSVQLEDSRNEALLRGLTGGDTRLLASSLFNDLEEPVRSRYPVIHEVKQVFLSSGVLGTVMTGSGSTVVGVVEDAAHGFQVCTEFKKLWRATRDRHAVRCLENEAPDVKELVLVDTSRVLGRWRVP